MDSIDAMEIKDGHFVSKPCRGSCSQLQGHRWCVLTLRILLVSLPVYVGTFTRGLPIQCNDDIGLVEGTEETEGVNWGGGVVR